MRFALIPHPTTAGPQGLRLTVEAKRSTQALSLLYRFEGPVERLVWPPPAAPVQADGLWKTTCCEAFLQVEPPAYLEVNAAPSGAWAAYAFALERDENRRNAAVDPPGIVTACSDAALTLQFHVTGPALPVAAPFRLGLTAVVEDDAGSLSYWALNHPKDKPDFHDARGFAALVPPGEVP